jgi:phosphate transport system substrate-binding protein
LKEELRKLAGPAAFVFLLSGCWSSDTPDDAAAGGEGVGAAAAQVTLTGAGATFPYPIYSRWFAVYAESNPVRVNYQSIGSGGGIRQMIEGTVDFGATDAPLTDEDLASIPGTLSIPTVLGAVVVTYNLPELTTPLQLDGETIAAAFLGEITNWSDPRLAALNPGVPLPDQDIIPVHRSDGSGTTYVFTDYLAAVSPVFTSRVGRGNAVSWPTGLGARGNEGVTGQVRQTPGSIGYVEQVYARQNDLPMAAIRNAAGEFVAPGIEATTAAAVGLEARIPEDNDFRLSIVNAGGAGAYPIASWTYLLIAPHMEDCARATGLLELIEWALMEGEGDAVALGYAPLTMEIRVRAMNALKVVTCGAENRPVIDPSETFGALLGKEAGGQSG